jgi:hypothetical protein
MAVNPGLDGGTFKIVFYPMPKISSPVMSTVEANPISLSDSAFYISRDLSLLEFQRRVLEQAQDKQTPLLERVKFMAIFSWPANYTQRASNACRRRSCRGLKKRASILWITLS